MQSRCLDEVETEWQALVERVGLEVGSVTGEGEVTGSVAGEVIGLGVGEVTGSGVW